MDEQKQKAIEFREEIFELYGFTVKARGFLRTTTQIFIHNFNSTHGGGFWHPGRRLIELFTAQHEAAVHEHSHAWWDAIRQDRPDIKEALIKSVVKLADLDQNQYPEYREAIKYAHGWTYGDESINWVGMFDQPSGRADDVHNLTNEDFECRVNDWEVFAGFCSWMMGAYKVGPHALPRFMWPYFEELFAGIIKIVPYYMGGHP